VRALQLSPNQSEALAGAAEALRIPA
jgi:cytochrome c-type biogenesis protein CcmH/NrfG